MIMTLTLSYLSFVIIKVKLIHFIDSMKLRQWQRWSYLFRKGDYNKLYKWNEKMKKLTLIITIIKKLSKSKLKLLFSTEFNFVM